MAQLKNLVEEEEKNQETTIGQLRQKISNERRKIQEDTEKIQLEGTGLSTREMSRFVSSMASMVEKLSR